VFFWWELRQTNPVLKVSIFRKNRVFMFSNLAALINYCANGAVPFMLTLYLQKIYGLDALTAGLIMVVQTVLMAAFSPITGKLSEMDLQTQTLKYMIKPSEIADLPENLIANVRLITSEKDSAIVLPRKAILSNETMTEFWVMKLINDSTAVKVPVKKGIENIDEVEITDPVFTPADRILLTGNYGLPDTARVFIIH
jgi:aromatic ring hydroxylase